MQFKCLTSYLGLVKGLVKSTGKNKNIISKFKNTNRVILDSNGMLVNTRRERERERERERRERERGERLKLRSYMYTC